MLLTIVAAEPNAPGFKSMAAFALKTVFAVAAFFSAVASGAGHPQCEERQAGISSSSAVLQLFTHDNCITEGLYDHQMIIQQAFKLKDTCLCHAVDMGVRQKISSMLFERGFGQPESVFYLLQGADCASDELGYGPYPAPGSGDSATALLHMQKVLKGATVTYVRICSSPEIWKKKLRELKAKQAAAAAKSQNSIWDEFGDGLKFAAHGAEKVAADIGPAVEKGLAAVGLGAAGVGALEALGVVVVAL